MQGKTIPRRRVLALGATIRTNKREIAADDYFLGLFETALEPGELLRVCGHWHILAFEQGLLSTPERMVQRIAARNADAGAVLATSLLPLSAN